GHDPIGQRREDGLAEAFLPHVRGPFAGKPPAVEEFVGAERGRDRVGDGLALTEQQRNRTVAAVALVAAARQTGAYVGGDEQPWRAAAVACHAERREPAPHRRAD